MMTFKQFVEDVAANAMGDGGHIATIDPLLSKTPLRRKKRKK